MKPKVFPEVGDRVVFAGDLPLTVREIVGHQIVTQDEDGFRHAFTRGGWNQAVLDGRLVVAPIPSPKESP